MSFTILENRRATSLLEGMLQHGRLPHTLLIEGPDGCGKRTFGQYIATCILCEGAGVAPCGECSHCRKLSSASHPDFQSHDGQLDHKLFSRDNLRELRRQSGLAPSEGRARVYLLAETQHMPPENQNLLLKLIEEPPDNSYFILTCPSRHLMLPTIQSRAVSIALEPLSEAACRTQLGLIHRDADPSELDRAVELSGGSLGRAMAIMTEGEKSPERQAADIVQALISGEEYRALSLLCALEKPKNPREGYKQVLICAALQLRRELLGLSDAPLRRHFELVSLLDEAIQRVGRNMGLSLITAALCAGATEM